MVDRATGIGLDEAAVRLGVHYMTAYRYVRTGRLVAERQQGRWIIDPSDLAAAMRPVAPKGSGRATVPKWDERVSRLEGRLLAGDVGGSWSVVEQALLSGRPSDIYVRLLAPALRAIGEGWQRGELTVADEHIATAVALAIVGRLGPSFARRGPSRAGTVLLAGAEGDPHVIPLAMIADGLRAEGWRVVNLGADVPRRDLVTTARSVTNLRAIGISVSADSNLARTRSNVRSVRISCPRVPVLMGGPAIRSEEMARELGAGAWAADLTGATQILHERERH